MSESAAQRHPLDRLAEDFVNRCRRGETPSISEYVQQYPEQADEIRDLFPTLALIEQARPEPDPPPPLTLSGGNEEIPEHLGDFRILREIGRGGMGIVYEAEQESLGRRVALKVLPEAASHNSRYLQRFAREAQAAARLHHTNIVPVFGVGEHEGRHFFVMQYIPGCGLDEVLRELSTFQRMPNGLQQTLGLSTLPWDSHEPRDAVRNLSALTPRSGRNDTSDWGQGIPGQASAGGDDDSLGGSAARSAGDSDSADADDQLVPGSDRSAAGGMREVSSSLATAGNVCDAGYWRNVARIGVQAARGLHYAHSQGTLHRDVKPANLLLDHEGTVWIADFGLARMAEQEDLTRTGDLVGTLRYMAPEQFAGNADERSDVYSLGLTLYELLTLRPAFDETDRARLIRQMTDASPPPPRQLNPAIPRDLETVVLKAIAREPRDRYSAAGELAADLERWLEDRPILARRFRLGERLWRWARRNRLAAALGGTALVSLVLAGIVGWVGYATTASALERASTRRDEALAATAQAEANMALSLTALEEIFQTLSAGEAEGSRDGQRDAGRLPGDGGRERPRPGFGPPMERNGFDGDRRGGPPGGSDGRPPALQRPEQAASARTAELLQTVLAFYDRFAELNSTNPQLEREAGRAHLRVAELLLQQREYERSLAAAARAEQIFVRLLAEQPGERTLLRELAATCLRRARAMDRAARDDVADRQVAEAWQRAEHAWLKVLSTSGDRSEHDELELAHVRLELAGSLLRLGRHAEAVDLLQRSTSRLDGVEIGGPGGDRWCQLQIDSLGRLADALYYLGEDEKTAEVERQMRRVQDECELRRSRRRDDHPPGHRPDRFRGRDRDRPPPRNGPPPRDRPEGPRPGPPRGERDGGRPPERPPERRNDR